MFIEIYRKRPFVGRGRWEWRLVVEDVFGTREIVATSGGQGYSNKGDMLEEIDRIRRVFATAEIVELSR